MTVKELIERLREFPEDMPVVIRERGTNSPDYYEPGLYHIDPTVKRQTLGRCESGDDLIAEATAFGSQDAVVIDE